MLRRTPFFNYRIFIWVLLILAVVMGGGFLTIAFTYNLQKDTERIIAGARHSVEVAKEMTNELTAIRGLTYTYLLNRSERWYDSLQTRREQFVIQLERARRGINTPEEEALIVQISALFTHYEQNLITGRELSRRGEFGRAHALIAHSAQALLGTIEAKCTRYIAINQQAEIYHETALTRANQVILNIVIFFGIFSIALGVLIGWLISRMLFGPINQLVFTIRDASGGGHVERLRVPPGGELDELGNQIRELIDRVNEANRNLSRNRELLQHSNKYATLGRIAPTIAHEIRNPLAAIKMLVYSMGEEEDLPPTLRDDLRIITNEIDRMERFSRDFLHFAKPSEPVLAQVNPSHCLQEVLQLLNPRFRKGNILIENAVAHSTPSVMADQDQLKQVFMNIVLNALDAMSGSGPGTLTITGRTERVGHGLASQPRDFLVLSFQDQGPGIPEAIMKTLFEPFIKGGDQGVGLGLSISQSIAHSHGGWINALNREGGGAVFELFLPQL